MGKATAPKLSQSEKATNNDCLVEVQGGRLIISIPFDEAGTPSASGKTQVHATTRGNKAVAIQGKVMMVGVNVFCK